MPARLGSLCIALALALAGCGAFARGSPPGQPAPAPRAAARVSVSPLAPSSACSGAFVSRALPFATQVDGDAVRLFDSNGSGVAIGDLDDDGRPDLVFANLDGPNAIFWNGGGMAFTKQPLDDSRSRAVATVDADGDGRLDIAFTYRGGSVGLWHNAGGRQFARRALHGVTAPAYAMAWGDLNGDGRLDLVTGSYDSELAKRDANAFLFNDRAGVYFYQQRADGGFAAERLARSAQALAIALPDLNADGRPDILVGNDFRAPDQAWLRGDGGWSPAAPFASTAESTMSIDQGDVDNDGAPELFATDMKPYSYDAKIIASWLPMMARAPQVHAAGDPQVMENVLQVRGADGAFRNQAYERGLDATGWSWSGKFGDLDNDGFLDLYVVNGMIAAELFAHLPGDELVEQNQALRNDGEGAFQLAEAWGLGATASGRGMSMADLDTDGDLDIVVNNLRSPALVFENRLCGGSGLEVELRWAGGNTRALGARLVLHTSAGTSYRDVRYGSGYLSGDAATSHFGVPAGATARRLDVYWPDGAVSTVDAPQPPARLRVSR